MTGSSPLAFSTAIASRQSTASETIDPPDSLPSACDLAVSISAFSSATTAHLRRLATARLSVFRARFRRVPSAF